MSGEVAVEVVGLTKRFGGRVGVEDLGFEVREGEVVGLLGPNGAGKTTTIRLLSTVLEPSGGRFWVAGVGSDDKAGIRRRVGVLPESAGYPGFLTGREYLGYYARLFGHTKEDQWVRSLLEKVGLEERAGSRISGYSRGMRQRLGIARALVNEPRVVLLDEPTLGLDPKGQRQVLGIVREIVRQRGAAVVLSTHTLPEVEQVCGRVLIMDRGRVAKAGGVEEVMRTVGVQRSGRLRVPVELAERAARALTEVPGVTCEAAAGRADLLVVKVVAPVETNAALQAVVAAGVPVLGFDVDGAGLGDAFLALTAGER